jgi:hypothetical protein
MFSAAVASAVAGFLSPKSRAQSAASPAMPPARATAVPGVPSLGLNAGFNGLRLFPGSEWYRDVSDAAPDPDSAAYLSTVGMQNLVLEGLGYFGSPYFIVDSRSQPLVPVVVTQYPGESDAVWAPVPLADDIVEGYPANSIWPAAPTDADRHVIVFDRATHLSYELYRAYRRTDHWQAASMTVWDTDAGDLQHPYGWTSADVAGLSFLMGLLRGEQVTGDSIDHAIRFTVAHNSSLFASPPAMHAQYFSTGAHPLPFGKRLRLKPSSTPRNIRSRYTPAIVAALKKYGMIAADTGTPLAPTGDSTALQGSIGGVNNDITMDLSTLLTTDFEVVTAGTQTVHVEGTPMPEGQAPLIAGFTASRSEVPSGTAVTLTPEYSGQVLAFVSPVGGVQRIPRAVTDRPARTEWYALQVNNTHGSARAFQRVIVTDGPTAYARYDRFVSPTGNMRNSGLTRGSPWPISVLNDGGHRYAIAGAIIGMMDGTYDVSGLSGDAVAAISIPNGAPGKPTVLQAVNPHEAIIAGGGNRLAPLGKYYEYASHIHVIGLSIATHAAPHCLDFFGQNDTGLYVGNCHFSGMSSAAVNIAGGYVHTFTGAFLQGNRVKGPPGTHLARLSDTLDTHLRGNTSAGGASAAWTDGGGNLGVVVD